MCSDVEVGAGFEEGRVGGFREDPRTQKSVVDTAGVMRDGVHLWLRDTPFCISFLSCTQTSHEYRLRATTCRNARCSLRRIEQ